MTKGKLSIVTLAVLLAGSIAANGYLYQQLNLEKQAVTDFTEQVSSLEKERTDLQQQLEDQQQFIKDLEKKLADAQKMIEQLKSEVQAAQAAVVEPVSTPTAETPATKAPSGKLDYSKMSQEEKEARAMAEMMGMSYEDFMTMITTRDPNANGGCYGEISRETLTQEQLDHARDVINQSGAHW